MPNTMVSEVFCGLAHHVGKRWLSFIARAVLSLGRSRFNAKHTGFRGFFVGWLIMLGRGDSLSLQELCFQYVEAALFPNTVVSDVFCGLAHHVGKRWLSFIARAVLSLGRSRAIAKHTGFKCFLWVGSSCWEEVTLFHCKSCAFSRSKPRYRQTQWFQMFFVGWLIMLGRGESLSLQDLCFH